MVENDSPLNHITDVISYNHYFGWYLGKVEDNAPWLDTFHAENPGDLPRHFGIWLRRHHNASQRIP